MRLTIPKNRTVPLIIFAILSIVISLTAGLYHMSRMARYSHETKLDTYDSLTENVALLLRQNIENKYQAIQVSANLLAKAGDLSRENISSLIPLLSHDEAYIDYAIIGADGIGYDKAGETVESTSESYYIKAMNGQTNVSEVLSYTAQKEPIIIFASPIIDNNKIKGVLLAKVSALMDNQAILQSELEEGSLIYIINEDKELVSYAQSTDIYDFNYNSIIEAGQLHDNIENSTVMDISEFFFEDENQEVTYIWDEQPLGINDWSVMIGRHNDINPITRDILRLTNMMWVIITAGTFILFIIMIITQRRSNRKVIKMLYLDPVTGGNNWYKFRMDVSKILNSKQFSKKKYAIINFDINRFKIINDSFGYQKGDEVLKDIYLVIKRWVKVGEPFTRYAADQFYIMLSFQEDNEVKLRLKELNDRLHLLRYTSTVKIYYGIYYITERRDSIDRMGEFASIAKNNIKGNSEEFLSFFDDLARGRLLEEEEIEKSMNDALKNEEFHMYLQPKYTTKDEVLSGAEALVRWFNKSGNIVSPGFFIPVFEKNGFITELDYYMLRKVCEVIRSWLDKGYTPLPISVNISRIHFANPHLAEIIRDIADKYNVPHHLIELELTESAFLQNKQILIQTVIRLREYGFLISMDDFGAGYSSLNSLKDLPLDIVKLDGELFRMTDEVERGLTVVRNTIIMAKDLHMKVVAECIETKEQVEFLCTVGCDMIQGYYYAKPMPVDQFEQNYLSFQAID